MSQRRRRIVLFAIVAVVLTSTPVVAGLMSGVDQPPRTELSIYEGSVEDGSGVGQPSFTGTLYLLEGEGVVVRGVQVEVLGEMGELLERERVGTVYGTTRLNLDLSLPDDDVEQVRIRAASVEGTHDIEVYGLERDDDGRLVRYEERSYEYGY